MNIRKNINYSEMHAAIDKAITRNLSQMELYAAIGKAVSTRTEKGAAVAAEYLSANYPDARGFSPRSLYFDDADYAAYTDKLSGIADRVKYRIRQCSIIQLHSNLCWITWLQCWRKNKLTQN